MLLEHHLASSPLVGRIEKREQKADGDRVDAPLPQPAGGLADGVLVQRGDHLAPAAQPLGDRETIAALGDG